MARNSKWVCQEIMNPLMRLFTSGLVCAARVPVGANLGFPHLHGGLLVKWAEVIDWNKS